MTESPARMGGGRTTIRVRLPHPDVLRRFCDEQIRKGTLFVGARETLALGSEVVMVFQLEGVESDLRLMGTVIPPPENASGIGVHIRFDDAAEAISAAESYLAFGEAALEDAAEEAAEAASGSANEDAPERRQHPRLNARARVRLRLHDSEQFRELYTKDLSRGGMFLVSQDPRPPGTEVEVQLVLPGRDESVVLSGVVTHAIFPSAGSRERPGMGLRLTISPPVQATLDEMLREVLAGHLSGDYAAPVEADEEVIELGDAGRPLDSAANAPIDVVPEPAAPEVAPTQPVALEPQVPVEIPIEFEDPDEILLGPDDSGNIEIEPQRSPAPGPDPSGFPHDAAFTEPSEPPPERLPMEDDDAATVIASPAHLGTAAMDTESSSELRESASAPAGHGAADPVRLVLDPPDSARFREVYARDIARGGIFIYSNELPTMGARVEVIFRAPGFPDEYILTGDVAHLVSGEDEGAAGAPGVGVRLDPLEPETREAIEDVLSRMLDAELDGFERPEHFARGDADAVSSAAPDSADAFAPEPPDASASPEPRDPISAPGAPWNQYFDPSATSDSPDAASDSGGPSSAAVSRPGAADWPSGNDTELGEQPLRADFDEAPPRSEATRLSPPPPEALSDRLPREEGPKQRVVHDGAQQGGARVSRHATPSAAGGVTMVVQYDSLDRMRQAYEQDIAKGGVFLPTTEALPLRSQCRILLVPPNGSEGVPLTGEVVHVLPSGSGGSGGGMGIQIVDLTETRRGLVADMLEGRTGLRGTVPVSSVFQAERDFAEPPASDDDIPMVDLEEVVIEDEAPPMGSVDPAMQWPPPSFAASRPAAAEPRPSARPASASRATPAPQATKPKPAEAKKPPSKDEAEIDRLLDAEFAQFPSPPPPPNVKPYQATEEQPGPVKPAETPKPKETAGPPESKPTPSIPTAPWASDAPPDEDDAGGNRFTTVEARELLSNLEKSLRRSYFDALGVKPNASRERISSALEQKRRPFVEESYPQGLEAEARELLAVGRERLAHVEETLFDPRRRATYECSQGLYVEDDEDQQPEGKTRRLQVRVQFRDRFATEFPEKVRKAEEYFRSASADHRAGKLSAALLNVKLAISYDPLCEKYHELLRALGKKD